MSQWLITWKCIVNREASAWHRHSPNLISVVAPEGYDIYKNRMHMYQLITHAQHGSILQKSRHLGLIAGLRVHLGNVPLKQVPPWSRFTKNISKWLGLNLSHIRQAIWAWSSWIMISTVLNSHLKVKYVLIGDLKKKKWGHQVVRFQIAATFTVSPWWACQRATVACSSQIWTYCLIWRPGHLAKLWNVLQGVL